MRTAKTAEEQRFVDEVRKVPVDPDVESLSYKHHYAAWQALRYGYSWSVEELAELMQGAMDEKRVHQ